MATITEEHGKDWKQLLRSQVITSFIGNPQEQLHACAKVGYYYMCCAPSSLYKYYSDSLEKLDMIKRNKMWYSAPCNFNDVFDCDISIDENEVFKSVVKMVPGDMEIRAGSQMWKHLKQTIAPKIRLFQTELEQLRSSTGISCLSELDDSLLMWAHYANNHRGMCVEYDLMEFNTQLRYTPVPVIYSDKRVCVSTLDPASLEKNIQGIFIESLTSKSLDWQYENEWRIIRDSGACGKRWISEKKGALLDAPHPKSIVLGCMVRPEFEAAVQSYCKEQKINLYKMQKAKAEYRLEKLSVLEFDN